jgi:hypothetical protein
VRSITRFAVSFVAATSLLASIAGAEPALDKDGKCRDNGKFVKQSLCEKPATKCRDITTKKFATCGAPNTEPVPSESKEKSK